MNSQTKNLGNPKEDIFDIEANGWEYDSFNSDKYKLSKNGKNINFVPKNEYSNIELKIENEKLFKNEQKVQNIRIIKTNESPKIIPIILDLTTFPHVKKLPEDLEKTVDSPKKNNFKPNSLNLQKYDNVCDFKMIKVKIDDKNYSFLIDTGADLSCCSKDVIDNSNFSNINFQNTTLIKGVTNNLMSTIGTCNLKLFDKLTHEFHILPNICGFQGIIGRDFFLKNETIISYKNKTIYLPGHKLEFPLLSESSETIKLPQRSQTYCKVNCNQLCTEGLVESMEIQKGIFLSNCLTQSENGHCLVNIINIGETDKIIEIPTIELKDFKEFYTLNKWNDSSEKRLEKVIEKLDVSHMNPEERTAILELCEKFSDIFYLDGDLFSHTNKIEHRIPISQATNPINSKPYRLPHAQKEEIKSQTEAMLENNIIRPSSSPWNSPLLVVPKKKDKNGKIKWRVVVDFRKLNNITIGDAFPLPNITEILDQLGGSKYFSVMDLNCGFHQIQLEESIKPLTAFSTPYGHFEYNRMPFGLKGAPATFQRLMNSVLSGLQGITCFVYMDDIVVHSKTLFEHIKKLENIFKRLRESNLKLQPTKCEFLRKEVAYLGHIITEKGIKPNPEKIQCIVNYPNPKDVKTLQSFLGLANYYRRFIPKMSEIIKPLTSLLCKKNPYIWNSSCQNSFEILKQKLSNAPILQYVDYSKPFILTTDASGFSIGAVLSQGDVNSDLPIHYASRGLTPAEKNYDTAQKEMLAIVWAVKYFRPYLYGVKFKIFTDHRNLQWVFDMKDPSCRLVRWRLTLSEYDFEIIYKPGKINTNADALSRINLMTRAGSFKEFEKASQNPIINPYISEYKREILMAPPGDTIIIFISYNLEFDDPFQVMVNEKFKISDAIMKLPQPLNKIFNLQTANRKFVCVFERESTQVLISLEDMYSIFKNLALHLNENHISFIAMPIVGPRDNINWMKIRLMLRYIFKNTEIEISVFKPPQMIVSKEVQEQILKEFHDCPIGGHQGVSRMTKRIKVYYNWPGLKKQIKTYVKTCTGCQLNKLKRSTRMPMEIVSTASKPFEKVYLDIVGPLTLTENGNKYALTFLDDLTKFFRAIPLQNQEACTVAKAFVKEIICLHGIPEILLTDQGSNFVGKLFKSICKLLDLKKIQTTAYHPQTNGALERTHRTMAEHLRALVNPEQTDWDDWLPHVVFTFNTTVHSSTGFTPFELLYGYEPTLPSSITEAPRTYYNYDDLVIDLKSKFQHCWKRAKENIKNSKEASKKQYDKKVHVNSYNIGDKVLLKIEQIKHGLCGKLSPLRKGPYKVIMVHSPRNYSIQVGKKEFRVNANRLLPFFERHTN
ncbi:MAG TPA: hypothetical protein DD806_05115 [Flavobacterium sp.]|nr:hypothetical protein [Flavobacterium sp.]